MPPEQPYITPPEPKLPEPVAFKQVPLAAAEQIEEEERARRICQLGDYTAILTTFHQPENQPLLEKQIGRLQSNPRIREALAPLDDALSPQHWEMLTLIFLFDTETFEHCLRTYQIVERKLQSQHPISHFLKTELKQEGVTQETLAIAALLHDVGKIGIPLKDIILNNTLTDAEWHTLCVSFCREAHQHPSDTDAEAHVQHLLQEGSTHNLREKDLVPFAYCLTPEQCELLKKSHINPELPLGKILDQHQDFSGDIARAYGLDETFIALVSNHHERPLDATEPLPVSQSALRIATIIRFADVFDAIHSHRAYKKGNPFLTTIAILIQKSHDGFIDPMLARLWIDEDMLTFEASREHYFSILPEAIDQEHADDPHYSVGVRENIIRKERAALTLIQTFLQETKNEDYWLKKAA